MTSAETLLPLDRFPTADRREVRIVLTDIDDTLTTAGRLTADAYAAIERLNNAGVAVVPVTGRPAGWCDHIARMWPVSGVVGENGAFYFCYDPPSRRMNRRYTEPPRTRQRNRMQLRALARQIVTEVPGCAVSTDQFARECDLAIDYREDVDPLPQADIDRIVALFEAAGASAKVSSIHVNGWFGDYDKLTMTRHFLREIAGLDPEADNAKLAFIGDSPNDAPMWAFFRNGIGVANLRNFTGRLPAEPRYITSREAGAGFAELADALIAAR